MTASAYPAAIGLISATLGIGAGLGLVIAGVIVAQLSWQCIFWLGLALTLTAIAERQHLRRIRWEGSDQPIPEEVTAA